MAVSEWIDTYRDWGIVPARLTWGNQRGKPDLTCCNAGYLKHSE